MPLPFDPNWKPETAENGPAGTDLASLSSVPDAVLGPARLQPVATDFQSLRQKLPSETKAAVPRTTTDFLLDFLIPTHILVMVWAVVFFLLDVRYVYTSELDLEVRIVGWSFVLGVVALNRLIARDGSEESIMYMLGLAGAIAMFTMMSTNAYDMGAVTRNWMNSSPLLATAFNMVVVVFVWWLVNRLTHECCVDENRSAGDIGILTGTARNLRRVVERAEAAPAPKPKPKKELRTAPDSPFFVMELEAIDPTEFRKPVANLDAPAAPRPSDRLATRHPGISIFFFAVPVLAIFAVGLRVVEHGGSSWILRGMLYMGLYVFASLSLLMLTSLAGLREYFRARKVRMPAGIGVFWIGLGLVTVLVVMIAALNLPLPDLPPLAQVDEHVADPYDRTDHFQVQHVDLSPIEQLKQETFVHRLSLGVQVVLGVTALYVLIKAAGWAAWRMLKRREHLPPTVVKALGAVDTAVAAVTRLPKRAAPRRKRARVDRGVALSADFRNSLGDPVLSQRYGTRAHIEHAYTALCALATDMGVPRRDDETPLEYIQRFPDELASLREEALDLTRLYQVSAYSDIPLEDRVLDRLRKFWITFDRLRNRVVR